MIAAGRGGFLQQIANYTPTAALRSFEQGLLRLNTVSVVVALSLGGFALAAIWLHTGKRLRVRLLATAALGLGLAVATTGSARLRSSWDMSENRRNSFSAADEASLAKINQPLKITVYLAPEDPRFTDLEQSVVKKMRRVLQRLDVDYAASSRSGLFENSEDHYGEIWYEMGGRKLMDRSTIEEVVLEQIYQLAGVSPPARSDDDAFPGYPLAVQPKWAALTFYLIWPLTVIAVWWLARK